MGADRVGGGVERVGVADLAGALDALVAHEREREVDAHLGGVAHRLVVDHVAVARAALGHDDVEARVALGVALADGVEQLAAADRLVGEHEDVGHRYSSLPPASDSPAGTACGSAGRSSSAGRKMPCTAPGTPYS